MSTCGAVSHINRRAGSLYSRSTVLFLKLEGEQRGAGGHIAPLQKHAVSSQVFPIGVLTKCLSLVPLGGPIVVGISARLYFTRHLPMLELLKNLKEYCEGRWVGELSVHTSSPATCQRQAQEARESRERRESSPSISEIFPKLKVQASILLATQTPMPLMGRP